MSLTSQLSTIQDVVNTNIVSSIDLSANILNIAKTNFVQVNDNSLNVYEIFDNTYGNLPKLVYTSNYRGLQETNDQLYFEDESNNSVTVSYENSGLELIFNALNDNYKRITRFFAPHTGKSLYIISLTADHIDTNAKEMLFEFGLESFDTLSTLKFKIIINSDGSGYINIELTPYKADNTAGTVRDISQNDFNIDPIDGTGISEFTYENRWHNQSFFILTDDNLSYIFGLSNGKKLIPVHSFNLADEYALFPAGGRTGAYRMFYYLNRNDALGDDIRYMISSVRIFKDTNIVYHTSNSIDNSLNSIASLTETPIVSVKYFDTTKYRGNVQLNKLAIYTDKIARIKAYYGRSTDLTLTTATWTQLSNVSYDFSANMFGGGTEIYSTLIKTETNIIDLIENINYKFFGYDYDISNENIILFTYEHLETGNALISYDLSWFQF